MYNSHPASRLFTLFIFCLVLTFSIKGYSQCNPPDQLPTGDCATAPLICLQNACFETMDFKAPGYPGWCGPNTVIHNPQYFQFIAIEENVLFHIHVDDCDSGVGLQGALLASCPWEVGPDVLDCDPAAPPGSTMVLEATGLIPGNTYYIVIDGSSGAICQYTFTYVSGVFEPEITEELDPALTVIESDSACHGYQSLTMSIGPSIAGAHGYYWVLGWSADTLTSTLPEIDIDIPYNVPPGIYSICAAGYSGCDTTNTVCTEIEIYTIDDAVKQTSIFCPEEFPFEWGGLIIDGIGVYSGTFFNSNGCRYDSVWVVESYPESEIGQLFFEVCELPLIYEDETYEVSGTYQLYYPNSNIYGCDSVAELTVVIGDFTSMVQITCFEETMVLEAVVTEQFNSSDSLEYNWYSCDLQQLVGVGNLLSTNVDGCYCVIISGDLCQDTICAEFAVENCVESCGLTPDYVCLGDSVRLDLHREVSDNALIDWLITKNGELYLHRQGIDTFYHTFAEQGYYVISVTAIDSGIAYTCHDVLFIDQPVIELCCDQVICSNCTEVTLSNSVGGLAEVTLVDEEGNINVVNQVFGSFDVEICPPYFPYTLTIQSVTSTLSGCPGIISADSSITISELANPIPIMQIWDTLCIDGSFAASINWYSCEDSTSLSQDACFVPVSDGCYCVEVVDQSGCVFNDCYEFIIESILDGQQSGIQLYPNPSRDKVQVEIPSKIVLPISWSMKNINGLQVSGGVFNENKTEFYWPDHIPSGAYYMIIKAPDSKEYTFKLIHSE